MYLPFVSGVHLIVLIILPHRESFCISTLFQMYTLFIVYAYQLDIDHDFVFHLLIDSTLYMSEIH